MDEQLAYASAWEQRELIVTKQVSPVELTELYLSRIDRLDPQLNSYLTVSRDEAMRTAKVAEAVVMRGDDLGPLHGLPIGIKDSELTKGIRSTSGSLFYKDRVPDEDTVVSERVRNAGAVVLGKTNTPEFTMLGTTQNRLGDHCRNPWNTDRTVGGSSGGTCAAVAASLCAMATGGDGGGSIRIPSSFCGVYGFKATQGRVPVYHGRSAPVTVDFCNQSGPMSRTVRDSAMMLQVLSGHDPRDPASLREAPPDYLAALDKEIKGLRMAWSADFGYVALDPEIGEIALAAAQTFEEMGCSLDEADLNLDFSFEVLWLLAVVNGYALHGHVLRNEPDKLAWYTRESLAAGSKVTSAEYARALGGIDRIRSAFADVFEKCDLLLSPTTPVTAFAAEGFPEKIGEDDVANPTYGFFHLTHPINPASLVAASVPCGFSSEGLPIGLQIIGRAGDEETVLAASAAFERARPWIQHRPPVS